jgi:peroxiredoxin
MIAVFAAVLLSLPLSAFALKVGDPYIPFTAEDQDGKPFDSAKVVGNGTVVLNFMNSVCSTCTAELEDMRKFLSDKKDVIFLPVAVDIRGATTVKPFKESSQFPYTFILDPKFALGRKYGASFTPYTVVIDKEGKIKGIVQGYDDVTMKDLQKLLVGK